MTLQRKLYLLAGTVVLAMLVLAASLHAGMSQGSRIRVSALQSTERRHALLWLDAAHEHYLKEKALAASARTERGPAEREALRSFEEARVQLADVLRAQAREPASPEAVLDTGLVARILEVSPELRGEELASLIQAALEQEEGRYQALGAEGERSVRIGRIIAVSVPLVFMGVLLAAMGAIFVPLQRQLNALLSGIERLGRGELDAPLPTSASGELGRFAAAVDTMVKNLRQTQAQLVAASRLASVGELAASVAHEVNNPLAFVLSNLRFVREELARPEPLLPEARRELLEAVDDSVRGAERISAVAQDLKAFSRPDAEPEARAPVDVLEVLRNTLRMAEPQLRGRARVVEEYALVPRVHAHAARLGQVFLNLLLNAAQAIAPGRSAENRVTLRTRLVSGGRVAIEVEDTGCGICPSVLPRIFEPFFTTKGKEGTGLGLSVCQGIIQSLNGELTAESTLGKGTLMRVVLPVSPEQEVPASTAWSSLVLSDEESSLSRHVLVIDDEPDMGPAIRRALGPGCHVTSITEPQRALDALCGTASYDAILCDMLMPGMTGMELYAETARRAPGREKRIVFITGGCFSEETLELLRGVSIPVIPKPFDAAGLRDALHRSELSAGGEAAAP
ncbi:ATP-binding protein [Vitiosangium sp. GDMCC 1.1324]|uniref:hybrid sensor histidine kinase/response regulator n=1 Tax=Vitiosangium sp. (strain GDMCC 1.1324) TaxID=2138576 RepID=UPI000D36ABC1|nr:ATP-binding protein [Vitiosangium sp. GDMCC 1.1324]PTL78594.1 hypothetical protein DAT35_39435 [Vitiosangium sp. GDMCC 1.1324]